jgi:hypothetical protein
MVSIWLSMRPSFARWICNSKSSSVEQRIRVDLSGGVKTGSGFFGNSLLGLAATAVSSCTAFYDVVLFFAYFEVFFVRLWACWRRWHFFP